MKPCILAVDDEINTLKVISAILKKEGFKVDTCRTGEDAIQRIKAGSFDLIISDYKLPGMSGEALIEKVKGLNSKTAIILLTAYGSIEGAVNAMRKGAYTYLTKPVNSDILVSAVMNALRQNEVRPAAERHEASHFLNIVGTAGPMQEIYTMIRRVSKTDANILILGESGTGKELVARAIHYTSLRTDKPFIPIDCTTIPSELMESELFGYEKGAFTCAYNDKIGLIEMANGGSVFFDEIGDLDYSLQKKLLRFIQEKEFHRLGGKSKVKAEVRIIAATNRDIESAVAKGEFRPDLYYRLNVITIQMPTLRERKEDIPLLASHFLDIFGKKNKKEIRGFEPDVMRTFLGYDWPGNVRELENIIERAVILCPYDRINLECLPQKFSMIVERASDVSNEFSLIETEKRIILKALEAASWNQSKASALLGISRKQLRTKMKNHGLM